MALADATGVVDTGASGAAGPNRGYSIAWGEELLPKLVDFYSGGGAGCVTRVRRVSCGDEHFAALAEVR